MFYDRRRLWEKKVVLKKRKVMSSVTCHWHGVRDWLSVSSFDGKHQKYLDKYISQALTELCHLNFSEI